MKASIVLLLVVAALVAGQDLRSEFQANVAACNLVYRIPVEELGALRATRDKTAIPASDNLKAFNKCVVDRSNYITPGVFEPNWERMIGFGLSIGYNEAILRANVEKCKPLYTGSHTAEEEWILYACIFSF